VNSEKDHHDQTASKKAMLRRGLENVWVFLLKKNSKTIMEHSKLSADKTIGRTVFNKMPSAHDIWELVL
jgi:hypothetical protein